MFARSFAQKLLALKCLNKPQDRSTWILRRVFAPEKTPEGQCQRNPEELPNLMKYEVVDFENSHPAGPLRVILLQDIEGVGYQFDVVEVDRKMARADLIPSRKAVYASPFDLRYYEEKKKRMGEELSSRVRIPYELVLTAKKLMSSAVSLNVSMEKPWTINKDIVHASLAQEGIFISQEQLHVDDQGISGPNFELEARLIRFYIVVGKQYVVPMVGKITHISSDDMKQVLYPVATKAPSEEELKRSGLRVEEPYFHRTPISRSDVDIVAFMKTRQPDMLD